MGRVQDKVILVSAAGNENKFEVLNKYFFLNLKDKELVGQAVYLLQEKVLRLSVYFI